MSKINRLPILLSPAESELAYREMIKTLPECSGISEENERVAAGVRECLSFGYFIHEHCIGLLSLEFPFPHAANIYWMGIKKNYQHYGIDHILLRYAELLCLQKKLYSLTVATPSLKETKTPTTPFYFKQGFKPLFELRPHGSQRSMIYLSKVLSPHLFKWIDLTHEISENSPTWDLTCGFHHSLITSDEECTTGCQFLIQKMQTPAGIGTHLDAPSHCFPQGKAINEFPLQSLISPCIVIDVSKEADEAYTIEMAAINKFEREFGSISQNSLVIFYTGWDRHWNTREKCHNHYQFPSLRKEVAEYLITKDIAGIGIDTLSPDRPDSGFPVHQIILGAGKYIIENVAHAGSLPALGCYSFAMPLPIAKGTESPIRLLACYPH